MQSNHSDKRRRMPAGPPTKIPPGFAVKTTTAGRLLGTDKNYSVYWFDKDTAGKSACDAVCTRTWKPMLAPQTALAQGDWSILQRSPGVKQRVYRNQPLYTYVLDTDPWSQEGSDVEGWHNVYTQLKLESETWLPTAQPDSFVFKEVVGPNAYGLNLDGKVGPHDFTSVDGTQASTTSCIVRWDASSVSAVPMASSSSSRTRPSRRLPITAP